MADRTTAIDRSTNRANMRKELTVRGIIIGVVITLVFTAANVYAGLKAALTFSTSIPAAVISMAILRRFRNATVQENNIVQTVASAAGTLAASKRDWQRVVSADAEKIGMGGFV